MVYAPTMEAGPSLDDLRLLCAVVEQGSFRAAAAHTGTSQPRVSRAVQRLESRLGRPLINRTPRSVAPTALGRRYAAEAQRVLADLAATEAALRSEGDMAGSLSVSAPPALGRRLLLPAIASFGAAHPDIRLDLSLGARRVDLIAGEVDLAIRFGPLEETWRRARRFLRGRYHVYGSPERAAATRGCSLDAALQTSPCLVLHATHLRDRWPFIEDGGLRWRSVRPSLLCDDVEALIQLTVGGAGLTMMPDFLVADEVRRGALTRLTSPAVATVAEVFAVMDAATPPARVTRLVKHLARALRQ